jgi:hypothetical protein
LYNIIGKFSQELLTGKKRLFSSIILTAIILPVILMTALAFTHGATDGILYGSLKYFYLFFILIIIAIPSFAFAAIVNEQNKPDGRLCLPFITLALSLFAILLVLFLSIYIPAAQLIRSGDTPPQLILSGERAGAEETGITLMFRTASPTGNRVEYGLIDGDKSEFLTEDNPSQKHCFLFTGLEPGKRYYYSLNGQPPVEFKAPPAMGKLQFAAAGDPHFGSPWSRNDLTASMLENIKDPANDYAMLFLLGDNMDLGFIDSQWQQAFQHISRCSSTIPVAYVAGNHETLFGGDNLYRDYFCHCNEYQTQENCLWRRIDLGDVHFLILDVEWSTGTFTSTQKQWLLEQLQDIPRDDWCIVMSHTFYYCSGGYLKGWEWYDNRQIIDEICPIFEEYDVDIVMSAHKHQAELLQMNNVTYLVLGCFGGVQDPERTYVSPASVWYQQGAYAFADITVNGDSSDIIFRDAGNNNIFQITISR